jgi:hypothetical protein
MLIEMQASLAQKHDMVILSLSSMHKPYSQAHSLCILSTTLKNIMSKIKEMRLNCKTQTTINLIQFFYKYLF